MTGAPWMEFLLLSFGMGLLQALGEEHHSDHVQLRDGDIMIGGAINVHSIATDGHCSQLEEIGVQSVEAMNMIIDKANANETLLPGIMLGTIMIDTCIQPAHAVEEVVVNFLPYFFDSLTHDMKDRNTTAFAGVVGAASSDVSLHVTNLLQVFSIPQVSFWSTSPDLSDKKRFKYFFRTVPPDNYQAKAIIGFVKQQNWNYISVIYENSNYGSRALAEIEDAGAKSEVCVAVKQAVGPDPKAEDYQTVISSLLLKRDARVVVIFTTSTDAREIILAAESQLAGYFLWIAADAWAGQLHDISYEKGLDGAVGFIPKASNNISEFTEYFTNQTLSSNNNNKTRNPWFPEYISKRNNCTLESDDTMKRRCSPEEHVEKNTFRHVLQVQGVADATLSLVYALHDLHRELCKDESGLCAKMDALCRQNKLAEAVYKRLRNISFTGISGTDFTFDENQDGPAIYDVYNYQASTVVEVGHESRKWVHVGIFDEDFEQKTQVLLKADMNLSVCSESCLKNQAAIPLGDGVCCWQCDPCNEREYVLNVTSCEICPEGKKPNEEVNGCVEIPIREMSYFSNYGLGSICVSLFGAVFAAMTSMLYVKKRDSPIAKAAGKELSFYTLFGVFLTFTNSLTISSSATPATCAVSRIILGLGPTCMYAAMLMKTLRVMIIFRSKIISPQVKLMLRPVAQIGLTSLITALQVFVLSIWLTNNPPEVVTLGGTQPKEFKESFRTCRIVVTTAVLVGLIYPFLLIIGSTVLATINRNVPLGFNEAKLIGFTMYTTCVIWMAFVPIFIASDDNYEQKLMTISICLSLSAYAVLICLFGPRCFLMVFRPEKNTPETVMSRTSSRQAGSTVRESSASTKSKSAMKRHNKMQNLQTADGNRPSKARTLPR